MSHDFPDGPDYNPEPLDDDPWDVSGASGPRCTGGDHWYPIIAPALSPKDGSPCECGEMTFDRVAALALCCPPEATSGDLSPSDA